MLPIFASLRRACRPTVFQQSSGFQEVLKIPMPYIPIYDVLYCFKILKRAFSRAPLKLRVWNLNSNKEWREFFSICLGSPGAHICMIVFLKSRTTEIFRHRYLSAVSTFNHGNGVAGSTPETPANLPILRLKARFCDVTCSKCQYQKSAFTMLVALFSILKGDVFHSTKRKKFCIRVLSV